ncbi:MAG: preprotein translocase subunit SecE [Bacilli bacterium]|jgi:preprotein translocase SecE subunit|nr:preprotein translocase subunit SecE [Bacilli bacterium]
MGVKKFTQDVIKEGKRVRWPKRDVLVPAIIVVVIIAAITGLLLMGEDALGKSLIDVLKNTFNK